MNSCDPAFISYSPEFESITGASPTLQKLLDTNAHEGPVYLKEQQALYFTTVPDDTDIPIADGKQNAIMRLDLSDFNQKQTLSKQHLSEVVGGSKANMANGMCQGVGQSLIICEQGSKTQPAQLTKLDLNTMDKVVLCKQWRSLNLNSLNDVVMHSDGSFWFTDPSYGYLQGFRDKPLVGDFVYRYDPSTEQIRVVADSFNKPNGLVFSPDEKTLYVTDSGAIQKPGTYDVDKPHHIRSFSVEGSRLNNERLFAVVSPGIPDGIKVDTEGHIYVSSASGVQVYSTSGELLGEILAPGVANFTFGGTGLNQLFILTDEAIWVASLASRGL